MRERNCQWEKLSENKKKIQERKIKKSQGKESNENEGK